MREAGRWDHLEGRDLRWDSPRSSTLPSTQQGFTLFSQTDYWKWVAFLHVLVICSHTPHLPESERLLGYSLPWEAVRMRAATLRKFSNPPSSWPPGFQQPPIEPLETWWKNGSLTQYEGPYPLEKDPMVGKNGLNPAAGRSPECARDSNFSPCLHSV